MTGKERTMRREKAENVKWIGIVLALAVIAMSIFVGIIANGIKVVPTKFIVIGCAVYVVGAIVIAIITFAAKRWQWNIVSFILFLFFLILSIWLYKQLAFTKSTLEKNAGISVETSQISVYVNDDDPAEVIADAKNYTFGILKELDRENTDETVAKINEALGMQIAVFVYPEITDLADAMMDGEVQALILNDSYYEVLLEWNDLLEESEIPVESRDYEAFAEGLRKLEQFEIEKEIEATEDETVAEDSFNYVNTDCFIMYISGQDAWGGVSGRSRSDVNILAVVNTNTHKVMLISTPRDYYLPLSVSDGEKDKLTHAGIYGVDCSRDTLEMLYGYNIDYYFKLNFSGFEAIIDALGGITVWSDYDFTVDPIKHYVVGDNYLTGLEALAFARERHALPGGDNARGQNQMNVIISVIDKMCSSALLNNYTEVLNSLDGMYITDMPYDVMASLIRDQIDAGQRWDIRTYAVTGTGTSASTYTMGATQLYVMEPNMDSVEEAKQLIQATLDGTLE
jgi:LCP family protein required for cell wall assembly